MAVGPLGQVHISVRDVDRSVEFYRDVLGMEFLFRVPGQPMAFFASGDVRLYLGTPERPEFTSKCVLYFRVDDIDAEYERLTEAGDRLPGQPARGAPGRGRRTVDGVPGRPGRAPDRPDAAALGPPHGFVLVARRRDPVWPGPPR